MRRRLAFVLVVFGLLVGTSSIPAHAFADDDCFAPANPDKNPWLLSQRVSLNDGGNIVTTRGLIVTLTTDSPYLHPNSGATWGPLYAPSTPSWVRQGLRIQSNASTYLEYGWEYWWQLDTLPNGSNWTRRTYYILNINGLDNKAHYLASQGNGNYRFVLQNRTTGTFANKFVLEIRNMSTNVTTIQTVLDPPFDRGNAFTLVTSSDSCNEMAMETHDSYRLGWDDAWRKVGTQYSAGWWYGQGGDLSNPATHWTVGGWVNTYEEWFTICYYKDGCPH